MTAPAKPFDVPEVLAALREVVADKGADYVYPEEWENQDSGCVYVRDGQPACIVGHVLARLDSALLDSEVVRSNRSANVLPEVGFEHHAAWLLRAAQRVQDVGGTWGSAFAAAERAAR